MLSLFMLSIEQSRAVERKLGCPAELTIGEAEINLSNDSPVLSGLHIPALVKPLDDYQITGLPMMTASDNTHDRVDKELLGEVVGTSFSLDSGNYITGKEASL